MKYEWEDKATVDAVASHGLVVLAVAVWNSTTGEGALISLGDCKSLQDIERADVWQDILGDVQNKYDDAAKRIFE